MIESRALHPLSLGDCAALAIQLECSAEKLGNVHPSASFRDMNHAQFVIASEAIGQRIDALGEASTVGSIALECVQAMVESAKTNTSLGTILLFAPLTVAFRKRTKLGLSEAHDNIGFDSIRASLHSVLEALTSQDSVMIYRAIQLAKPGGLGASQSMDVQGEAPVSILDAMRHAATWDDIALQYVSCFELVFAIADRIRVKQSLYQNALEAIRHVQLELLSERVDSLIARKRGAEFAIQVKEWAKSVVGSGEYRSESFEAAWRELDKRLRHSSNGANPGTIADLIAGATFVLNLSSDSGNWRSIVGFGASKSNKTGYSGDLPVDDAV